VSPACALSLFDALNARSVQRDCRCESPRSCLACRMTQLPCDRDRAAPVPPLLRAYENGAADSVATELRRGLMHGPGLLVAGACVDVRSRTRACAPRGSPREPVQAVRAGYAALARRRARARRAQGRRVLVPPVRVVGGVRLIVAYDSPGGDLRAWCRRPATSSKPVSVSTVAANRAFALPRLGLFLGRPASDDFENDRSRFMFSAKSQS